MKERKHGQNLEKKYLPHKNYEGCEFLENGGLGGSNKAIYLKIHFII